MPELVDYDVSSLYIDPTGLSDSSKKLLAHAKEVADTITSINNTLSGLALGWAGKTQEEADKMNNQWTATMRGLFGTEDAPESGVLNVMALGVVSVAAGNAHTEVSLAEMFQKFLQGVDSPGNGDGTPGSAPEDMTNIDTTAITADW
ncbi:WXG100 family type VII secretion target [Streptomyces sp. NBC_00996]|uniref:WXG100 family type VII secretion target n=1 Tax=Streptomyces sp. NBC_00996 TaxID=2903710 RepID=UPI0038641BE4|nr:WXG100 family type VII secretion target [Streptomyces sp. NBC_00996]